MSAGFVFPDWARDRTPPQPTPQPALGDVDPHRVEALVNNFIAAKQDALFDSPDAYYRTTGRDAVDGAAAVVNRLTGLRDATLEQVRDDGERATLGPRLDLHIDDARDGVDRHVTRHQDEVNRQTIAERQRLIQRAAELEHNNDDKLAGLAEAHASAAQDLARMNGEPEGPASDAARSTIWRTAIGQRLAAGDDAQAVALFDRVKDQIAPDDHRHLELPLQAAAMNRAADQWIEREAAMPGDPLTMRLQADPDLSPLEKAVVRTKIDARDSVQESRRAATVMGLDDRLGATAHAVATMPATYKSGTLAALANAYDEAGEPGRAAAMRRLALQEPLLLPFAQVSAGKQQAAIEALPEEVQPAAKAIQRQQVEAFAKDPFAAGTALYPDVGQPASPDDIAGRIIQARTIAERRGIPVAPYSQMEIDSLRKTLAAGAPAERKAVLATYEALPGDMQRALMPLLWPQPLTVRETGSDIPADDPALHADGAEKAQVDETPRGDADASPDDRPPDAGPPKYWNRIRVMTPEEWRAWQAAQSQAGAPPTEPAPGSPEYQAADAEAKRIVVGQQVPAASGSPGGVAPTEPPPGSPGREAADAEARRILAEQGKDRQPSKKPGASRTPDSEQREPETAPAPRPDSPAPGATPQSPPRNAGVVATPAPWPGPFAGEALDTRSPPANTGSPPRPGWRSTRSTARCGGRCARSSTPSAATGSAPASKRPTIRASSTSNTRSSTPSSPIPTPPVPTCAARPIRGGHLSADLPYRSVWFERGAQGEGLSLRVSGYSEFPCMAPRWDVVGTDSWGTGPGWIALGDSQQLQIQQRRKLEAIDRQVKPVGSADRREIAAREIDGLSPAIAIDNGCRPSDQPSVDVRMPKRDLTALSRTMSHALRHEPWLYELELDPEGWTPVEALLAALRSEKADWKDLGAADFAEVIRTSAKRRFDMADDRIRALYGHSVPGKLARTASPPPERLYHGTSPKALDAIRQSGLLPMARQYVHLSNNRADAAAVGRRKHPQPVILSVRAAEAAAAGVAFYAGNDKVWLADGVPWRFIADEGR